MDENTLSMAEKMNQLYQEREEQYKKREKLFDDRSKQLQSLANALEKQKKYRLYRTRYGYIQLPYQYAYKQYTGHCAQRKLTDTQFPQPESQEYSEENGKFGAFPELVENPFHNQVV